MGHHVLGRGWGGRILGVFTMVGVVLGGLGTHRDVLPCYYLLPPTFLFFLCDRERGNACHPVFRGAL